MIEHFGFHVVLTIHNSRFSKRMVKYNVIKGEKEVLTLKDEILVTKIIGSIIIEKKYNCVAYNICQDHVHLLLVCESYKELIQVIKNIKGKSSYLFRKEKVKLGDSISESLWSQKFFRANLDEWSLGEFSKNPGEIYSSSYIENTLNYIYQNRLKHNLPASNELQKVINGFVISLEAAYEIKEE